MEEIEADALKHLYQYWDDKRGSRAMPSRADLDPIDIPSLLPYIILIDVEQEPRRYRIRLYGTHVVERFGKDLTGQYLDEADLGTLRDKVLTSCDEVVDNGEPNVARRMGTLADGRDIKVERLILPLSNDGRTVSMIFGGIVFEPLPKQETGGSSEKSISGASRGRVQTR